MICPRNFLQMADSVIIDSLHLVIPFISMVMLCKDERENSDGIIATQIHKHFCQKKLRQRKYRLNEASKSDLFFLSFPFLIKNAFFIVFGGKIAKSSLDGAAVIKGHF